MKSPTGRQSYRQVAMAIKTRCQVGNLFCTVSRRISMASPKPVKDKLDHKQQAIKTNRQGWSMFPTLPHRTDCFCGSVSIFENQNRYLITLYKPLSPVMCHSFHTSKMTGTYQEQLIDNLRVLLFFIELNVFFYLVIATHRRQPNPAPVQPASPSPQYPEGIHRIHGSCPGYSRERRKVVTEHSWAN